MTSALIGNTIHLESALGFGELTRAVQMMLVDGLDDALAREKSRWDSADLAYQQTFGGPGQIDLDPIPAEHIHPGPHRSLLKQPVDAFPTIAAMAYYTQPVPGQAFDHISKSSLRLMIEVVCISGPYDTDEPSLDLETTLQWKAERTVEAVHKVIWDDKTLRGVVHPGISEKPRGGLANQIPARREAGGAGPRYLLQGGKLDYAVERQTSFN